MKINDKYTFDLNFVEERTQQIFDFHNFIDRCLVEMQDIHLLDCSCGCCKGNRSAVVPRTGTKSVCC
jgi:hypothetical protein